MGVVEMRMLKSISGNTRKDIQNEEICLKFQGKGEVVDSNPIGYVCNLPIKKNGVAFLDEKVWESCMVWSCSQESNLCTNEEE